MEIILGMTAGFCYGVRNAVSKAEERLKENKEVYCLGELVHNGQVINRLEGLGLKVVDNIEDAKDKVIIRAHGIAKEVYDKANELNIEVFDYTCPSVLRIHKMAEEYVEKGYYIILIGGKKHPECIGTFSFCGDNSFLIENEDEVEEAIEDINRTGIKNIFVIVQTTFSLEKFEVIINKLKENLNPDINLEIKNTICNATKIRQEETCEISKKVQYMIIIGGKNSSNTKKLYELSKKHCSNTIIVETKDELDIEEVKKYDKVGIMAGASTPDESIQEVIEAIKDGDKK